MDGESVCIDNPDERHNARLVTREVEMSFERIFEGLKLRLGHPLVERRCRGGHGRSLDKRTRNGAVVIIARTYLSSLIFATDRHLATGLLSLFLSCARFYDTVKVY